MTRTRCWVTAACCAAGIVAISLSASADTWYVDAENGNDEWDGKAAYASADPANKIGPKKTLSVFTSLVGSGDTIYAAPGHYNELTSSEATSYRFYTSVGNVSLIATGSATNTFIEGAADPGVNLTASPFGCGANAIIPVKMLGGNNLIKGFTIAGGRQINYKDAYGGGVVFASKLTDQMIDCVVTNCVANRGGGVYYLGTALRCHFTGNYAAEGAHGLNVKTAVNCLFENTSKYAVYNNQLDGTVLNCTFRGNKSGNYRTFGTVKVYNSVLLKESNTPENKGCDFYNCLFDYDPTVFASSTEAIVGTNGTCRVIALGTAKLNADGTPMAGSPALDAGDGDLYTTYFPASFDVSERALDLVRRARTNGASLDLGALERQSDTYDDNTWYVDKTNGNDANDGRRPGAGHAFASLARASTNALMKAGATVYVAEGVYDSEIVPAELYNVDVTDSRMYVPDQVSFVATGRRSETVVVGATSPDTTCGIGSGAVRCCLMRSGSVRGFTMRGGNVNAGSSADSDQGGGIRCTSSGAYAYDCEIYNCNAVRGGGAIGVRLVRCYLHDNTITTTGVMPARSTAASAAYRCSGYNSVIAGDCYQGTCYLNCTILGDGWGLGTVFLNCYLKGDGAANSSGAAAFTNCVFAGSIKSFSPREYCVSNSPCAFNGDFRARSRHAAVVDAADKSLYEAKFPTNLATYADLDFAGGARFLGDALDIGAGERDMSLKGLMLLVR